MSHRAAASANLRQIKNDCLDLVFFTSNVATREPPASETMTDRKEFSSTGSVVIVVGDDLGSGLLDMIRDATRGRFG